MTKAKIKHFKCKLGRHNYITLGGIEFDSGKLWSASEKLAKNLLSHLSIQVKICAKCGKVKINHRFVKEEPQKDAVTFKEIVDRNKQKSIN